MDFWKMAEDMVKGLRDRILAVLPPDVAPKRFLAILTEYLFRSPALFDCAPASLEHAIMDAACLGLEVGPPFELAAVVPYKNKKQGGPPVASLMIEYRGHMIQVYRSGRVKSINARPVYAGDSFVYQFGLNPLLTHKPTNEPERGQLTHAYAIAELAGGGTVAEVINQHDAARARADSPGASRADSLWQTRTAEMWTKTAIKRLISRMPRAPAARAAKQRGDPPAEFAELLNAVCLSPGLYKQALSNLDLAIPSDAGSISAILSHMRTLYKRQKQSEKIKEPST